MPVSKWCNRKRWTRRWILMGVTMQIKYRISVNSQLMGPVSKMAIVDGRKIFQKKKRGTSVTGCTRLFHCVKCWTTMGIPRSSLSLSSLSFVLTLILQFNIGGKLCVLWRCRIMELILKSWTELCPWWGSIDILFKPFGSAHLCKMEVKIFPMLLLCKCERKKWNTGCNISIVDARYIMDGQSWEVITIIILKLSS